MSVAPIRTLKRASGGGAKITYYDGTTELGFANVPEGQDVLHPSVTVPTKTGKTFIGWSTTTSENNWVGELTANGQPMSLYAIYLDNTKTISSADGKYVTGTMAGGTRSPSGTVSGSVNFTLAKGRYNTASISASASFDNHDTSSLKVGDARIDSTYIVEWAEGGGSYSKTITANNGTHTLSYSAIAYDAYWQSVSASASVTLSNPIAWT